MKNILLVCTGNLCRSPMATAILKERLAQQGLADEVRVESAGIWAGEGRPASAMAQALLAEQGLDLGDHRSRPTTEAMLRRADLVIVMEEEQRRFLFHLSMRDLPKIFLLSELSGGHQDVPDPFGGTREEYLATIDLLTRLIDAGMPRILKQLKLVEMRDADERGQARTNADT